MEKNCLFCSYYEGCRAAPWRRMSCRRILLATCTPSKKVAGWTPRCGKWQNIVAEETSAIVCPVPASSTSVSQPLDVGVMGPLKKKLSAEWLRDKVSTARTTNEKRIAAVMRTIRAWRTYY
ncbi:hypothetical protein PC120_g20594 [Phytophthora cactorum]|nr:hypothetical protein PC120_g20594 [Phytophthora cactorum]